MSALIIQVPLPESLDDMTAYDLIFALTVKRESVADEWIELLAKWALAKAERVDELEDLIAEFKRAAVKP